MNRINMKMVNSSALKSFRQMNEVKDSKLKTQKIGQGYLSVKKELSQNVPNLVVHSSRLNERNDDI